MKNNKLLFLFPLLVSSLLFSCTNTNNPDAPEEPDKPSEPEYFGPEINGKDSISIHYQREGADYNDYALWLRENNGGAGLEYTFNGLDEFGAYAYYNFEQLTNIVDPINNGMGFIVKSAGSWDEKDTASDRFIDFANFQKDGNNIYHIYLKTKDENIYTTPDGNVNDEIQNFQLVYNDMTKIYKIWLRANKVLSSYQLYVNNELLDENNDFNSKEIVYEIKDQNILDIKNDFKCVVTFKETNSKKEVIADKDVLFDTDIFDEKYYYDGELGAIYSKERTIFRVWSPVSETIKLRIYESGTPKSLDETIGIDTFEEFEMVKNEKGVFEYEITRDMEGKYYTYVVKNSSFNNVEIVDPYAKSAGINGVRGMIVDFSKTNPSNWNNTRVKDYSRNELTVYETHIADITSSITWNGNKENSKKYSGAYESGTKFTEDSVTVSTGFDHIKELGVNAVQILPFFDQENDERTGKVEFNWGYNPLNYNVLEGAYSNNPYDGYERIKEMKTLIQKYNEAGINIIMDVVYNHVNGLSGSNFDVLMPKYYFRYLSGKPSNGSGCGNETASERSMFRKFMIDSTSFLAKEYKLGGYRFDLMGLHDVETMNLLTSTLHSINPNIVVYGEPWAAGTTPLKTPAANQSNLSKFDNYGAFNDVIRDALIKGGLNSTATKGWVNSDFSSESDKNNIKNGILGITNSSVSDPNKTVNYVTCHDNYTLRDRMIVSGVTDQEKVKKMAQLANSIIFTGESLTFMLAGEEFLRTKNLNGNSYNSTYEENELDYSLKIKNQDMFENYKKLISFKQNTEVLSLNSNEDIMKAINFNDSTSNYLDYEFDSNGNHYRIIHVNGADEETPTIDLSGYKVYLDTINSDKEVNSQYKLEKYQSLILYK